MSMNKSMSMSLEDGDKALIQPCTPGSRLPHCMITQETIGKKPILICRSPALVSLLTSCSLDCSGLIFFISSWCWWNCWCTLIYVTNEHCCIGLFVAFVAFVAFLAFVLLLVVVWIALDRFSSFARTGWCCWSNWCWCTPIDVTKLKT